MSRRKSKNVLPDNIRPITDVDESICLTAHTYDYWRTYLYGLAINSIIWKGLPPEIDERFLEMTLCEKGYSIFFRDEIAEVYVSLPGNIGGQLTIYNIPMFREAVANNGYRYKCDASDSVIIFNNYMHTPDINGIELFARRLTYCERSIDSNINMQKFGMLIKCSEQQRLTMQNMFEQYSGFVPVIWGDEDFNTEAMQSFPLSVPYVADKMEVTKHNILNDFLTWLGAENANADKRERMTVNEVGSNYGNVELSRNMRLNARKQAAKQINEMFGLNINPVFNSDLSTMLNLGMEVVEIGKVYNAGANNNRASNTILHGDMESESNASRT